MGYQKLKITPKERNLIKGALRRVFSRSELRLKALEKSRVTHHDPQRDRVKKWSVCALCLLKVPTYTVQIDHIDPLLEIGKTIEDYNWDELVERLWCDPSNLQAVCTPCHKAKSKEENALRRKIKKERKNEKK